MVGCLRRWTAGRKSTGSARRPLLSRCGVSSGARWTSSPAADRFWLEELRGGTLPFIFPGQILNNTPLLDEDGDALTDEDDVPLLVAECWLVQFAEAPNFRPRHRSVIWTVPLSLNILP